MGLPMFQEPDEAIAKDAAAKLDRAAAIQRSTIRRQATVRPSRYNPDSINERLRAAGERHRALTRRREERESPAERQIRHMEAEIARLRRRNGGVSEQTLRDTEWLTQNMREADAVMRRAGLDPTDAENEERAGTSPRRFHLSRPNRESNLRFEVSAPHQTLPDGSTARHSPILGLRWITPPSSSGSGRNVPDGPILDQQDPPVLTEGFAPARYHPDDLRSLETPPPETWESSLPPLDRSSRRPDRPTQRSIDGLGDRHRSPSAERSGEEENWANLLTTLEPRHSSTATSFASAHDSGSHSRNSQSTVATSFGEIGADDGCDLDLPPGINEEIAREIREQHRSRDRQRRRNGEPDGPVMTGAQGLRMHQARLRRARDDARDGSRQIQMIQEIMERFGNYEEVPDEWWSVMGWDDDTASETPRESRRSVGTSSTRRRHPGRGVAPSSTRRRNPGIARDRDHSMDRSDSSNPTSGDPVAQAHFLRRNEIMADADMIVTDEDLFEDPRIHEARLTAYLNEPHRSPEII